MIHPTLQLSTPFLVFSPLSDADSSIPLPRPSFVRSQPSKKSRNTVFSPTPARLALWQKSCLSHLLAPSPFLPIARALNFSQKPIPADKTPCLFLSAPPPKPTFTQLLSEHVQHLTNTRRTATFFLSIPDSQNPYASMHFFSRQLTSSLRIALRRAGSQACA